jgi:sigma-B regulation protein RsbU (phosphoserine phosphatase)
MRIELGKLKVQTAQSILDGRKKLFRLLSELTENSLLATRISTATSQNCKQLASNASQLTLAISLDTDLTGNVGMNLIFSDTKPLGEDRILSAFFEHVRPLSLLEDKYHRQASMFIPVRKTLSKDYILTLESIIKKKSRDELIGEVKATNEELRESLENLRRTRSAKERMESELNIGKDIQMSMLPLKFPPFPERKEIDIFALLHPAREVGGDFYDFFFIDEKRFCFCVGDVSGKGVPAALFMAMTKTLIKSRAADDFSTASIITHVNDELSEDNKSHMFVTIFICILDTRTGEMSYTNAGHNPPFLRSSSGLVTSLDTRHGPVVGALDGIAYKQDTIVLSPNDQVILFTDGVTEAMDKSDNLYSENRLISLLSDLPHHSVDSLVDLIVTDVKAFENGADQADDITILTFEFVGEKEKIPELKLEIWNDLAEIDKVNEQFNGFANLNNISQKIRRKMNMIFDELLSNIINYGFPNAAKHKIETKVELFENRVVITIIDDGIPFNPFSQKTPDTSLSLEEREIGGLGIHMVKNAVDKYTYLRNISSNVVSLIIHIE